MVAATISIVLILYLASVVIVGTYLIAIWLATLFRGE